MLRFFYIVTILIRYFFIYLAVRMGMYTKPKEKILRNFFEETGGAFVKFGQLLSLRVDVLPKEYSLELLDLLDNMKQFSYKEVQRIFLQELGAPPEKIFKDFQKVPFASASFGQVHAAKLKDDTIVAVKVMRPGIEEDVMVDFFFIDILAFFADLFFKIEAIPWKEFASEFEKWTKEELDYHIEAEHMEKIYKSIKNSDSIVVPKVFHRLSTKKILVQEYIDGIPLSRILRGIKDGRLDYEKLKKIGVDIRKSPRILVMEIFRQYFCNGFFHADPHPGNILLIPGGKIGLIDFGILGEALPDLSNLIEFLKHASSFKDEESIEKAAYHALRLAGNELKQMVESAFPANVDQTYIDGFIETISKRFSNILRQRIKPDIKELDDMTKDYTVLFFEIVKSARSYRIRFPKQIVVFIRTMSIIFFLAKQMDNSFKIREEITEFFQTHEKNTFFNMESVSYKRLNRERALEQFNNWLSYLFEEDPGLYKLVKDYVTKYNVVTT